ncbi:glutathione S-transferase D7-like [Toxorhynchites rutilus septentrionalis]|uniref:glutathione S-transferase D7-like n=1 Tax=Toxorhynchites rutilus septentrionalis TaxID=329112 RepID=UPI00247B185B|nr:glutathione S-transferase D7-like [Toxorhynchites rutilus septentrionalis]
MAINLNALREGPFESCFRTNCVHALSLLVFTRLRVDIWAFGTGQQYTAHQSTVVKLGNCIEGVTMVQSKFGNGGRMVPVLYYAPQSPPCRSVLMLARRIGLHLELKLMNEEELTAPAFLALNPQHTVPTLDDRGLVLSESRVILSYLASAYGNEADLYPRDYCARAVVDQRLQFDLGTFYQRVVDYFWPTLLFGASLEPMKKAKLEEALGWFESMLKYYQWAAGNHFTIADISLCVSVSQIDAFEFDLGAFPRVCAWFAKCKKELMPFGYEEINQAGANTLAGMFRANSKQ